LYCTGRPPERKPENRPLFATIVSMHFNTCVIVENANLTEDELIDKAASQLNAFDINLEVPVYKKYIDPQQIQSMREFYKTDSLQALAENLSRYDGAVVGGLDEKGLYGNYTANPNGHLDYWNLLDVISPKDRGFLLYGVGGEEKVCHAIITPDGTWTDAYNDILVDTHGDMREYTEAAEQLRLEKWIYRMRSILAKYDDAQEDCVLFLADCHL
jgi:hypothetical protein